MKEVPFGRVGRRSSLRRSASGVVALLLVLFLAGCGSDEEPEVSSSGTGAEAESDGTTVGAGGTSAAVEELYPDVLEAQAVLDADGTWTFSATLSSPYDTPARYADAWRVVGPDGEVYGVRELTHDHQSEQPFTRSSPGIEIPDEVTTVTVQGRDQLSGWGGATVQVELPGRS